MMFVLSCSLSYLPCRQVVPGGVYQRCQKRPVHRPATPVRPQLGLPVLNPPPRHAPTLSSSPSLLLLKQSLKSMHDGSRLSYHLFFFFLGCVQGWRRSFKKARRSHLYRYTLIFIFGKNEETCIHLTIGRQWRPLMFPSISLSLSGTSAFQ